MVKKADTNCIKKVNVKKGAWTAEEDRKLVEFVKRHGNNKWRYLPAKAGLNRCGKSCRLRWLNYLRPGIKRGNFSEEEEDLILRLHSLLGNRWSLIAGRLPGRTDNEIKNHWNTHLSKKSLTITQLNQKISGSVEMNGGGSSASPSTCSTSPGSHDTIAADVLPVSNEQSSYQDCFISSSAWGELPVMDFDLEALLNLSSSRNFPDQSSQISELGIVGAENRLDGIDVGHSHSAEEVGYNELANLLDYEVDAAFISFFEN